jgi:hypothetical protein
MVYGAIGVFLFWWTGLYAQFRGEQFVQQIRNNPAVLSAASFVTREPMGLPGEVVRGSTDHQQYVHNGYRVLAHNAHTMLLLPPGWGPERPEVVTLTADSSLIYIEFGHNTVDILNS